MKKVPLLLGLLLFAIFIPWVVQGETAAFCQLEVKPGWNAYALDFVPDATSLAALRNAGDIMVWRNSHFIPLPIGGVLGIGEGFFLKGPDTHQEPLALSGTTDAQVNLQQGWNIRSTRHLPEGIPFYGMDATNASYVQRSTDGMDKAVWLYAMTVNTDNVPELIPCGSLVTRNAQERMGYTFTYWTASGIVLPDRTSPSISFIMPTNDVDLTTKYTANSYTLVVDGKTESREYGAEVSVVATKTGYSLTHWTATGIDLPDATANPLVFNMPANDVTLTANYTVNSYALTVDGVTEQVPYGTTVTKNATTKTGNTFQDWTATGIDLPDTTANPLVFTMPANDVTLAANYAVNSYALTVDGKTASRQYGAEVSVEAIKAGYSLTHWTATGIDLPDTTANPLVFIMPANDVSLTANYTINTYFPPTTTGDGITSVTAKFTADASPLRFLYTWKDGTTKEIVVQPGDASYLINSNTGKTCNMPQAGYQFQGLGILDYVRPNIAILNSTLRTAREAEWPNGSLGPAEYELKVLNTRNGAEFYINGNYAGTVPFQGKKLSHIDKIQVPLEQNAFSFTTENLSEKFQILNVKGLNNPGEFNNATVNFQDDGTIPFGEVSSANLDLGLTAQQKSLYPNTYGDSGQTGRNAFDHAEASYLFTIPLKQYSHLWVLCACEDNPAKHPTMTARITRYVPSGQLGGRAYSALGDTPISLPHDSAEHVGAVQVGGKTLPLWRLRIPVNMGKVIDLVTDYSSVGKWGRGAFKMLYLDFELMGEIPEFRTTTDDPRVWPDPKKISGIHIFGATLERAGMDVKFMETTVSRNMFDETMTPEMKVAYQRIRPGNYTLSWEIYDYYGNRLRADELDLEGESGEKTIDLAMEKLGWYKVIYTVFNGDDPILCHEASYALMGKDTRQASWDSPYIGWAFGSAHYGDGSIPLNGSRYRMLGVRYLQGLDSYSGAKYTEKDWEEYKCTTLTAGACRQSTVNISDETLKQQITSKLKKFPHAFLVPLYWEDARPFDTYTQAPELFGEEVPQYTAARQTQADQRWEVAMRCYRVVKTNFPQLKVVCGNSMTCTELIAELLRRNPPSDLVDALGTEAIQRTAHPEKPFLPFTMSYSMQMNKVAELLGYGHLKTTCGPENICRKHETIGMKNHAEWLVRDMLLQHVFGFETIAGATEGISGVGNVYDQGFYGGGPARTPYLYPTAAAPATGTLTKVLDCVTFTRIFPTGSNTVYCAEFSRAYDAKTIYAIWTSRGSAEMEITPGEGNLEVVDFFGNASLPSLDANKFKLTAGTAAQYVIADSPFVAATTGTRTFDEDPLAPTRDFTLVDPLDAETWTADHSEIAALNTNRNNVNFCRVRAQNCSLQVVDDTEMGRCLELSIDSNLSLNDQFCEYLMIRPQSPIPISGNLNTVGMWVKGNSGWGEVYWEIEDVRGNRRISSSTKSYGQNLADYTGRVSLDYNGWCFLSMPVTSDSKLRDLSTGSVKNIWVGNTNDPVMPCKLTGIVFCAPVKPIFLNTAKTVPQTIRIKDFSVIAPTP